MIDRAQSTEATIFARVIAPGETIVSSAVAKWILTFELQPVDRDRMHVLAAKARQGTLTRDEQTEIDCYERVGDFLSLLKSKARRSLQQIADRPADG